MSSTKLEWKGPEVAAKVRAAEVAAVDETTQAAAEDAQGSHWWKSERGQLEGEIVSEPAKATAGRVRGRFGSTQHRGFYGLILEYRAPFLRPAADREFPKLFQRIRGKLR